MKFFNHSIPSGSRCRHLALNLFYRGLCRAAKLKEPVVTYTDDEDVFRKSSGAIEHEFAVFARQPFADQEVLRQTRRGLRHYEAKFWLQWFICGEASVVPTIVGVVALLIIAELGLPDRLPLLAIPAVLAGIVVGVYTVVGLMLDHIGRIYGIPNREGYLEMAKACRYARKLALH